MDLQIDVDDQLVADVTEAASRAGMTPEAWVRSALRVYLGIATVDELRQLGPRVRRIEPL